MSDNQDDYEKYNHAATISRQIDRINDNISKGMQKMEEPEFELYIHQVMMSVLALDAMILPWKEDKDFYDEVLPEKNEFRRKDKLEKIKYATQCLEQINRVLSEENLFYAKKYGRRKT